MYSLDTLRSEHPQSQDVMLYYKTTPCPSIQPDNEGLNQSPKKMCFTPSCFHYHNFQEMRRPVFDEANCFAYDSVLCQSLQGNFICPDGARCKFSHSHNEIKYHPLYYKTEPCAGCENQAASQLCPYYHSEEDSRNNLLGKVMMMGSPDSPTMTDPRFKPGKFNLDMFKVKPCTKKGNHNVKICDYYHHDNDRRRPTNICMYTPPMCQYIVRNAMCPNGDNCLYSHNKLEQLYHPERYKRKFCLHYPHNVHKCEYGNHCSFAHYENEIMIELLHNIKQDEYFYMNKYKTVFCPYIYEHDRNQCIYAHNPQDLRRDPNQYKYNAVQCTYWFQGQIFSYEEGGCPNQMECHNCHGWKELEYHPLYYKTKPCNNAKKCTKKECPFFHSNPERRQIKITSQLTRSLLSAQNSPTKSGLLKSGFSSPGTSIPFEPEPFRGHPGKPMSASYQQPGIPMLLPFRVSESENSRKMDLLINHYSGSTQATTAHDGAEEDIAASFSFKPSNPLLDSHFGFPTTLKQTFSSPEKGKTKNTRSAFPQAIDLWGSLQQGHGDNIGDYFSQGNSNAKEVKANYLNKGDQSFDSLDSGDQNKNGKGSEKPCEMSNEQFRKALGTNLDKKGLQNVKPYLLNPMIDLKALKSFSQKDFALFPHISYEDKEKIVKIIQDIIEEEALLSEVNIINAGDGQQGSFSDDDNLFKSIGSH